MNSRSLLLDTHVWVRSQIFPRLLSPAAAKLIQTAASEDRILVSVVSVWELAMLERDGRVTLSGGVDRWTAEALAKPGISLLPLSRKITIEAVQLPKPMHKDPSDRFLVASARVENLTLVTADKAVLKFAKLTGLSHQKA